MVTKKKSSISWANPFAEFEKTILQQQESSSILHPTKRKYPKRIKLMHEYLATDKGQVYSKLISNCIAHYSKAMPEADKKTAVETVRVYLAALKKSRYGRGNIKAIKELRKLNKSSERHALFFLFMVEGRIINVWKHKMKFNLKNLKNCTPHEQTLFGVFRKWFLDCTGLAATDENVELYLCKKERSGLRLWTVAMVGALCIVGLLAALVGQSKANSSQTTKEKK